MSEAYHLDLPPDQRATRDPLGSIIEGDYRYRLLVESVKDYAIFILSCDGRIMTWNPGAERIKGYKPDQIIGSHFSRFYTEEDRAAGIPWNALRTAAETGRFITEGWRLRKDGTRFWAMVVIDPIRQDGQLSASPRSPVT